MKLQVIFYNNCWQLVSADFLWLRHKVHYDIGWKKPQTSKPIALNNKTWWRSCFLVTTDNRLEYFYHASAIWRYKFASLPSPTDTHPTVGLFFSIQVFANAMYQTKPNAYIFRYLLMMFFSGFAVTHLSLPLTAAASANLISFRFTSIIIASILYVTLRPAVMNTRLGARETKIAKVLLFINMWMDKQEPRTKLNLWKEEENFCRKLN